MVDILSSSLCIDPDSDSATYITFKASVCLRTTVPSIFASYVERIGRAFSKLP